MFQNIDAFGIRSRTNVSIDEIRIEMLRKSIHLLIALVPSLAFFIGVFPTTVILAGGVLFYATCETLRMYGKEIPIVSSVTSLAARKRDAGKFVLGPITLGLGAMLSLILYPEPAASIAIYALAFGDGLSSLVGKLFGTIRLPFTGGKSLEGSLTCFTAVFVSAYALSGKAAPSAAVAVIATLTEACPLKDFDNIILPLVTGCAALLLL